MTDEQQKANALLIDKLKSAAPVPQSVKADTEYIVLELTGAEDGRWSEFSRLAARDGNAAIKEAIGTLVTDDGMFVAVPARSWKPVKVTTRVETSLVLEETT